MKTLGDGSLAELKKFLKEFDTALIVTLTPDHMVRSRPMVMQNLAACRDCDLWFVTRDKTAKVAEINHDEHVGVVCFRESDKAYISISAEARIEQDHDEIHRLWKPSWRVWAPQG